jgi:soluble lytic murein transglycosylase-like protein
VIIVTLSQPVAAVSAPATPAAADAPVQGAPPADAAAGLNPALPLVLPDQVSAPGGTAGPLAAPAQALPAVATSGQGDSLAGATGGTGDGAAQTYAQMFQEVAQRYDIDWRMLAAQAYIESSFDSLALSGSGAMGLMQILPGTWREWAPAVAAADPFDSRDNVLVAAAYLDFLRTKLAANGYNGKEWMLVAYNWGPERLDDFLAGGGAWENLPDVRRQYAEEILRIAQSIP